MNVAERDGQPVAKLFFAEVRQIAPAAIAGATVIGVAVLLEFRRHRTVVVGTVKQAGKSEVMLAILRFVVAAKDGLHLLEQFRADERHVGAVVELVFPDELPFVEGVFEQSFEIAFGEKLAELILENLPHTGEGMQAGGIELEHPFCDWRFQRVNLNRVFELVVAITQRRTARVDALFGLLPHALAHFLAQVFDIVPCNDHLNAVYKLGLRLRVFADDLALFGKVDFDFQIFQRHAIAEVAIQAISLFDNGDAARGIFAEVAHHLAEVFAPCGFGRLHVNEFVHNLEFMCAGVLP